MTISVSQQITLKKKRFSTYNKEKELFLLIYQGTRSVSQHIARAKKRFSTYNNDDRSVYRQTTRNNNNEKKRFSTYNKEKEAFLNI
jgi:hypothetical protein